jgi:hypothetical protein
MLVRLLCFIAAVYLASSSAFLIAGPSRTQSVAKMAAHHSAAGALDFLNLVGLLKKLKRTGWVREGVHLPESVAGESMLHVICPLFICSTYNNTRLLTLVCHHVRCLNQTNRSPVSHGHHELSDHRP